MTRTESLGASLAGAGLGTTFSSTMAVGGVQGLTTGIAIKSNTEILNSAFAQFEGKPNQISIEESMSRIFNHASMTTDAIAGGVAEGLLYMANSATIKNQAQICAEGEISKNARLQVRDTRGQKNIYEDINASATIDDILKEAMLGRVTKGKTTQYIKIGSYKNTSNDFDALNPLNIREIKTKYGIGKTGTIQDGRSITSRPGSSDGRPTLEIRNSNGKGIEIRYGEK